MKSILKVSAIYGVSELCIWELIRQGFVKTTILFNKVVVDEEDVRRFFEKHPKFLARRQKTVDEREFTEIK